MPIAIVENPGVSFFFGLSKHPGMVALESRARDIQPDIYVYRSVSDDGARDNLRTLGRNKWVEVWGADTFACVGTAIMILIIEGGVEGILLDLTHVREYETDVDSDGDNDLKLRAYSLLENLLDLSSERSLSDDQLALISVVESQREIWDKAISQRRATLDSYRRESLWSILWKSLA